MVSVFQLILWGQIYYKLASVQNEYARFFNGIMGEYFMMWQENNIANETDDLFYTVEINYPEEYFLKYLDVRLMDFSYFSF
jgi:hypothetical protein